MAYSINRVELLGYLGKDPKTTHLNSGDRVVNFSIATLESWKDKSTGEKKERTEWHNIVVFNEHIGKIIEEYCKKGSRVHIVGKLQTRKYIDIDGKDRYTTEIVLQKFQGEFGMIGGDESNGDRNSHRERRNERSERSERSGIDDDNAERRKPARTNHEAAPSRNDPDDDIPF